MASPIISVVGVSKSFPGRAGAERRPLRADARRGPCADGRERRRQIDADEDPRRRLSQGFRAKSFTTARASISPVRAKRSTPGIGIIHQELQLMNHLTVAQNIFIGREPKRAFGLLLDEDKLNRDAAAAARPSQPRPSIRAPSSASLTVAKQQMVEIAKALSFNSRVLIMDEPTAALNNAEIAELFKMIRELKAPRRRHRLHLPQDRRAEADRRPRHGAARRRIRRHARRRDDEHRRPIISMMVGRTISDERCDSEAHAAAKSRSK